MALADGGVVFVCVLPNFVKMIFDKKLSCRRETARCLVSLNISLSTRGHSRSSELTPLSRAFVGPY